jgi:hypothetical protein
MEFLKKLMTEKRTLNPTDTIIYGFKPRTTKMKRMYTVAMMRHSTAKGAPRIV